MERLVDKLEKKTLFDPAEECLADLIRSCDPVVVSPARQQRVLNRVTLRQQSATRRSATSRLLRPVLALGVLSLAGATAAATIGRRAWIDRHTDSAAVRATAPVAALPPIKRTRSISTGMSVGQAEQAPEPVAAPRVRPPRRPARVASHPRVAATRLPGGEDPSRVVDAIQALRTDRDPVRASKLLSEYLVRYPHGALAEEAVALSIEAAAARRSPSAVAFAERYLQQYPNGRFRRAAEQALEQRSPQPR